MCCRCWVPCQLSLSVLKRRKEGGREEEKRKEKKRRERKFPVSSKRSRGFVTPVFARAVVLLEHSVPYAFPLQISVCILTELRELFLSGLNSSTEIHPAQHSAGLSKRFMLYLWIPAQHLGRLTPLNAPTEMLHVTGSHK